jgi:hypothetical protein
MVAAMAREMSVKNTRGIAVSVLVFGWYQKAFQVLAS